MKKLRFREIFSSVVILLGVLLIGCEMRAGWWVQAIGGTTRITVMVNDRRWFYVGLDVVFLMLDVEMYGAWSGWWPNHVKLFLEGVL